MLKAVYGAGLTAGTKRGSFQNAGFVPPDDPGAGALGATPRRPPGYSVRKDGLETLVITPLCQALP